MDECEVHLHPRLAKIWQKRGQPGRVPAAGADREFVVFGALDYASGQVRWQLSLRKGGQALVAFVEQLRHTWPDEKLVVVLDKVGYHTSRQTLGWWQQWRHQCCPFFLPAHTPELNLMERAWRYVKDRLSCHRWWAAWQTLWGATTTLLTHVKARFHDPARPGIDLVQNFCASA